MSKIINGSRIIGEQHCPNCAVIFEYTPDDLVEAGRCTSDSESSWNLYSYYVLCPNCHQMICVQESRQRYTYKGIIRQDNGFSKPADGFLERLFGDTRIDYDSIQRVLIEKEGKGE